MECELQNLKDEEAIGLLIFEEKIPFAFYVLGLGAN